MPSRAVLSRQAGPLVGLVLAVLALFPVLVHRGYVLVGDMVFLPRPPWSRGLLGLSAGVPRAVPSDLLATLSAHLLPGDIAQKLLLVSIFVIAAAGGARLLAGCPLVARVTAAAVMAWNPYVAERLALGQWAVLLGYAALPWVLVAAGRVRGGETRAWPSLLLALALAALTPTGGLVAVASALLVLLCGRAPAWRAAALLLPAAAVLDAPWLLPALLRPGGLPAAPEGVAAFAARADTPLGIPGSLATLGGIWSGDAVPSGRDTAGLVLVLLLVLVGVVVGTVLLLRGAAPAWPRPAASGLVVAAALSLVVAAAGATPGLRDLLRLLIEHVPAAGLLRDGPRHLGPLAVLEAAALGLSAEALARQLPGLRRTFAVLVALVPVLLLPGLAAGISGRLVAVDYPSAWAQARSAVAADPVPGAVLALPWSAYRAPQWNRRRTVLDPAVKAFGRRVVADDRLRVGRRIVPGEDALAARLTSLATGTGPLVADARAAGIRWVLVERDAEQARLIDLRLDGAALVVDSPELALWRLPAPAPLAETTPPAVPVVAGDVAALALLLAAAAARVRSAHAE
ncbi:MAG: hypothetical protein QOE99_205 [Actinomycetota bacterium]|nr:hypothetical protein [Actinomycetota bacterium]